MTAANSDNFEEKVVEYALHGRESPWFDVKACLYKLDSEASKGEFARDIIAFANTARYTGRPCYIVFGITDQERTFATPEHCDGVPLEKQYPGRRKPKGWDNPKVSLANKMIDGVEKVFQEVISQWVEPKPEISLAWGWYEGHFVSYLKIEPPRGYVPPYRLKRSFEVKTGRVIRAGEIFIRYGASTQRWSKPYEPPAQSRIPYLSKEDWLKLRAQYLRFPFEICAKWLQRFPLYDTQNRELVPLVLDIIANANLKFVRISAPAGSGKSMLLRSLAFNLAQELVIGEFPDESPKTPVPVYLEMNQAFRSKAILEDFIKQQITNDVQYQQYPLNTFFQIPEVSWVLLLDGLDEIHDWEHTLAWFKTWLETLPPNVFCVLSARPYIWETDKRSPVLEIRELTLSEARLLFEQRWQEIEAGGEEQENIYSEINKIWQELEQHPYLLPLFKRPRGIDALLDSLGGPDTLIQPLSEVLLEESVRTLASSQGRVRILRSGQKLDLSSVRKISEEVANVDDDNEHDLISSFYQQEKETNKPIEGYISPSAAGLYIVNYFWEKEREKKAHIWGASYEHQQELEKARHEIQRLAWELPWDSLKFNREALSEESLFYGERVSILQPFYGTQGRCEAFSSPVVRWVEMAMWGFGFLKARLDRAYLQSASIQHFGRLLNRLYILWFIDIRVAQGWLESDATTKRVIEFINILLEDNGLKPLKWRLSQILSLIQRFFPKRMLGLAKLKCL